MGFVIFFIKKIIKLYKQKKATFERSPFNFTDRLPTVFQTGIPSKINGLLVEAAGVEPASGNIPH